MLDHDEQRRLREIEAQLRVEAPELHRLFVDVSPTGPDPAPSPAAPATPVAAFVASCTAIAAAIALTALVTMVLGPDVGGLVGVLSLAAASMYAYQVVRGCPGLRARRHDDR